MRFDVLFPVFMQFSLLFHSLFLRNIYPWRNTKTLTLSRLQDVAAVLEEKAEEDDQRGLGARHHAAVNAAALTTRGGIRYIKYLQQQNNLT